MSPTITGNGRLAPVTDVFSEKLAAWRDYTETPWARRDCCTNG